MVTLGQLYAAVVMGLLLAALGVSIPVLIGIFRDGLERHTQRVAGRDRDPEARVAEDVAADADTTTRTGVPCRQCGVENDPTYTYCRCCTEPL